MTKMKKTGGLLGLFTFMFFTALMLLHTPAQAADKNYTYDEGSKTLTITADEGFNEFSKDHYILDKNMSKIYDVVVEKVIINPGVTKISGSAFIKNKSIKTVIVPEGVTYIGTFAFEGSGLESITLPDSLTSIDDKAFLNCTNLKSIIIPDGVTVLSQQVFGICSQLAQITLPQHLLTIGDYALSDSGLTSLTIPKSVTSIGENALARTPKLKLITMESAVPPSLGADVFKDKPGDYKVMVPCSLNSATLGVYRTAAGWSTYASQIFENPHVPGDWIIDKPATEKEPGSQHQECTACKSIVETAVIPAKGTPPGGDETVEEKFTSGIYTYAVIFNNNSATKNVKVTGFAKGKSTSKLNVNKTVTYKGTTYKITGIADKAFYKNTKIKQVNLSNNITSIGKKAFYGCSKITTAVIGNKVTAISDFAFYKCTGLKKVTIGTGLKTIGKHVFCRDKKLSSITIKSSKLTKVGKHNLYQCHNLKIKVPSSKVKAYTKLFKNQGQKANVKVTK